MDNKANLVQHFAKYCAQCNGLCCKRGVFTVFGREMEKLSREYGSEIQKTEVFDQRGTACDLYIGGLCVFNEGNGCKLPTDLRPTDCLSFPFYPKLKEINGKLEINSFVIQNECPFSNEIATDEKFLEAMQELWENTAKNLTKQEIIDWIGANGSWQDWYDNAIEVKCNRQFNLKLKDDNQNSKAKKSFSFRSIVSLVRNIFVFSLIGLPQAMIAQGITNSSGYITCIGSPYITIGSASLNNGGTYTKASETVLFSGTVASELKGNSTNYHNIIVSNSGGITLNTINLTTFDNLTVNSGGIFAISPTGKLTINTTLTNSAGTTGLVINSTVAGSGSLIHSTAGVSATVNQFLTDDAHSYHYHTVSPPISNATGAVFKILNSAPYLYTYDPNGVPTKKWFNIRSSATALTTGTGYLINFKTQNTAETLAYSGTLNTGSYTLPMISTGDGYNLAGNPYPCSLDWDAVSGWTRTGIGTTIWEWVPGALALGNYGSYVSGIGGTLINNIIPSGQGFFVYATGGSPVLGIANGVKVHNNSTIKAAFVEPVKFKLRLTNDVGDCIDEAIVYYSPRATTKYDTDMEAVKFFSLDAESSQIYTRTSDSSYLSINALPVDDKDSIPLFFKCGTDANYTIAVVENTGVDTIVLTDLLSQKKGNLLTAGYTFVAHKTDTTSRFIINLTEKGSVSTGIGKTVNDTPNLLIYANGGYIYLRNLSVRSMEGNLIITNMLGQTVSHEKVFLETEIIRSIHLPGVYIVSFTDNGTVYKKKIVIQ